MKILVIQIAESAKRYLQEEFINLYIIFVDDFRDPENCKKNSCDQSDGIKDGGRLSVRCILSGKFTSLSSKFSSLSGKFISLSSKLISMSSKFISLSSKLISMLSKFIS